MTREQLAELVWARLRASGIARVRNNISAALSEIQGGHGSASAAARRLERAPVGAFFKFAQAVQSFDTDDVRVAASEEQI